MPGLPGYDPLDPTANLIRSSGLTVNFVDAFGRTTTARLSGLGAQDLAVGENSRLAQAMGEASNMGVYGFGEDRDNRRLIPDATAFDETYADATNVLYLVFQNNEGRTITTEVPAPQARLFESDGVTLKALPALAADDDTEQAIIRELIDASLNVINTSYLPLNSYTFVRGSRRSRKVSLPQPANARPQVVEPGTGTGTAN